MTTIILLIFTFFSLSVFVVSNRRLKAGHTFTITPYLSWLGIFVWGDGLIIAPFWAITSILIALTNSWNLFFFIFTLFWLVRSYGEVNYWIHEQFAGKNRNNPKDLVGFRFVNSEAIYFIYQLFWQMIMIVSIIGSIYFGHHWLTAL